MIKLVILFIVFLIIALCSFVYSDVHPVMGFLILIIEITIYGSVIIYEINKNKGDKN